MNALTNAETNGLIDLLLSAAACNTENALDAGKDADPKRRKYADGYAKHAMYQIEAVRHLLRLPAKTEWDADYDVAILQAVDSFVCSCRDELVSKIRNDDLDGVEDSTMFDLRQLRVMRMIWKQHGPDQWPHNTQGPKGGEA